MSESNNEKQSKESKPTADKNSNEVPNFSDPKNKFKKLPGGLPGLNPKNGKTSSMWLIIFFSFLILANFINNGDGPQHVKTISYDEFLNKVENEELKEVTFVGHQLYGATEVTPTKKEAKAKKEKQSIR